MNNSENQVVASGKSVHSDCMQRLVAYTMIVIWLLCLAVNNPYTDVVQAVWILYVAIINFNTFVQHRKKISLVCTIFMISYFVTDFIVML